MKTCASCFRCCEDWRDAKAKGLEPRQFKINGYSLKPRFGVNTIGMGVGCPERESFLPGAPACTAHIYRWRWNLKTWWVWHFSAGIKDWFRRRVRVPIGKLRRPAPLARADDFDSAKDQIIAGGLLVCPRCGEVPYNAHHCVFCGQRFLDACEQVSAAVSATIESAPPLSAKAQADIERLFSDA